MTNSFNLKYNIYGIFCKDPSIKDCYIGSTRCFSKRKFQHKCEINNIDRPNYKYKVYKFIRDHGGFDNWDIEKLYSFKPKDVIELRNTEREYIDKYRATLNTQVPNRSPVEYRNDKKLYLKTSIKCDCGGKYTPPHRAIHSKSKKHIKYLESLEEQI
tara:strand:+ start:25 stop:495 length:471 start_codon:yes stop_codon:yes gene_type:complete